MEAKSEIESNVQGIIEKYWGTTIPAYYQPADGELYKKIKLAILEAYKAGMEAARKYTRLKKMATLGSLLTTTEFAKREGITPQAIRKAIKENRIRADKYYGNWWLIHSNEKPKRRG